jgi:hypothetical protein
MNNQALTLTGTNLKDNSGFDILITASNPFMLGLKYQNLNIDFYVEGWNLSNRKGNAGNNGINAGAYLFETLTELTGLNLS